MKSLGIITLMMAVILICPSAFGASLSYAPGITYLTIAAGSEDSIPITVSLNDGGGGTYDLWFADRVQGDISLGWVSTSPPAAVLSEGRPAATATLTIRVPEGMETGTYSVYVFSRARKEGIMADAGSGRFLKIFVPANCAQKPEVVVTSFGPEVLWVPNKSTSEVTVKGMVIAPKGCSISEAGYKIDDEYGEYSGSGKFKLPPNGGGFTTTIPVEASRKGSDKDGRLYSITVYAEDQVGIGVSRALEVVVPHDQSGKAK